MYEQYVWVIYACSLLVFIIFERVLNVIFVLFGSHSHAKTLGAKQVVVSQAQALGSVVSNVLLLVLQFWMYLLSWWILILILFGFFSIIYVSYEETPQVWISLMLFYNARIGPWLSQLVVIPLYLTNILFKALVPFWNMVVWFVKVLVAEGFLPIIMDEIHVCLQIAQSLFDMIQTLVDSLYFYITSFDCTGSACLVPAQNVFNVISPFGNIRQIAALGTKLSHTICSYAAVPMDIFTYPFMDLNLAECVHNFVNAFLHLFFSMPIQTSIRCGLDQGTTFKIMMCTPDFTPFFQYLVASVTSLGVLLDNWLNVCLVIAQETLTGSGPSCDVLSFATIGDILHSDEIFGNHPTTVIGLTGWTYAVTDGRRIVYKGQSDNASKFGTWPYAVNVGYGVAAVSYSSLNSIDVSVVSDGSTVNALQTTALMGCNCSDTSEGPSITCSIAPMEGYVSYYQSDYFLNVFFPDTYVTQGLYCANIDIYIKSVRWPFYRYSGAQVSFGSETISIPTPDCISKDNCRVVDATVWVVPRCGSNTGNTLAICLSSSNCFPYCMGSRVSGSVNNNIILSGADMWRRGKTLVNVDCNIYDSSPSQTFTSSKSYFSTVQNNGNVIGSNLTSQLYSVSNAHPSSPVCYHTNNVVSRVAVTVPFNSFHYNTYSTKQPFVIAGDVVFTSKDIGGGMFAVVIERLTGDQQNAFTLQNLAQDFPAEPPLNVLADEFKYVNEDRLLIPYATRVGPSPAVSTKNFVFYASNPDYNVFSAYLEYCSKADGELGKFGLLITSSYGPIRIYRVNAYVKCTTFSCGANLLRSIDFDGFKSNYSQQCNYWFNTSITHMEYLNEDNIIIVVSSSPVSAYDASTMTFSESVSSIYWLNPSTMQVSTTIWQTTLPPGNTASLCPSMQRLPRLGSFAAELVNAGIYFVKYLVYIPVYMPGMTSIWAGGGVCPQMSHGHSMLASCGSDILSLENFFDSLYDAQSIIWHTLSSVAYMIQSSQATTNNPIADVLHGMAEYGEGTIDLWAVSRSIVTLAKIPVKEQLTQFVATMQDGSVFTSLHYVQGNTIMWARFIYKVISDAILVILKSVLGGQTMTKDDIWQAVWTILYQEKAYYTSTVTKTNQLACNGIQLMLGMDNPWAKLAYYQCVASSSLIDNILDTLLNINVYVPMAVCVCKQSVGMYVPNHAASHCAKQLPMQLRPELFLLSKAALTTSTTFCSNVLDYTRNRIVHSLDPWFDNMYNGIYSLSEAVDYLLIVFDSQAGQCRDFAGDPHVVSIIPQPIDYFQKCSSTSLCKTKCSAAWEDFQYYKTLPVSQSTVSVDFESMFFPGQYDSSLILNNATAVVEVSGSFCITRSSYQDISLMVAEYANNQITIRAWCVPQAPSSTIYIGAVKTTVTITGDIMQSYFIDPYANVLCLLLRQSRNSVYLLSADSGLVEAPVTPSITAMLMVDVVNIWPVMDTVCIDVIYKSISQDLATYSLVSTMVHYYLSSGNYWVQADTLDLSMYGQNYFITNTYRDSTNGYYSYILFPKLPYLSVYKVTIQLFTDGSVTLTNEILTKFDSNAVLPTLSSTIFSSYTVSTTYILAVHNSGWDWLKQVRYSATGGISTAKSSTAIQVDVTQQGYCDENACNGCPSLLVQRLCQAYNKCALINCVGTLVNQIRPLCAVGLSIGSFGTQNLQFMQGAWTILAEMICMILQLSLNPAQSLDISWPEDVFMGYICSAKDMSTEFWSVITSTLNSIMHLSLNTPTHAFRSAGKLDRNSDAALTISSTSLNAFFSQITLSPLYSMIVIEQILLCQMNGVLALVDKSGYSIRIQSASLAGSEDVVAGSCLTKSAQIMGQYSYLLGSNTSTHGAVSLVADTVNFLSLQVIDPFIHMLDGFLTYLMGITHTFAVWIMSMYMEKCNPPDFFLSDNIQCACDDYRLSIPDSLAYQGVNDFALWCSGTLGMIDSNNQPFTIVNPYTYGQLRDMASNLQQHVECLSKSYDCPDAAVFVFDVQGISLTNVLVKCRENFMKKQWDPKAYAYFDSSTYNQFLSTNLNIQPPIGEIADCLVNSHNQGAGPQACQEMFMNSLNLHNNNEYWVYERANNSGAQYTDACLVFSGPGIVNNLTEFRACVDGYDSDVSVNCSLNPSVWEITSDNDVPVAEPHIVWFKGIQQDGIVQKYYQAAQEKVLSAILESIYIWGNASNPEVNMDFFSTEGDAIHQIMDCIFMGPYSRINYWPIPLDLMNHESLKGPSWSRDENNGQSRIIDIDTCASTSTMPFTCGSQGRKSVIRYFVKNILSGQRTGNANTTLIQKIVLAQLYEMYNDWKSTSLFGCVCADNNTQSPTCCDSNMSNWLPPNLQRPFQDINSSHVLNALDEEYEMIYNQSIQTAGPWITYNEDYNMGYYSWAKSVRAKEEGLYDPSYPTYNYSDNLLTVEAGGVGLWGICHASLKQIFFTLPVYDTTLTKFETVDLYDGNPANLESTIKQIVDLAWEHSPLYRHYHPRYHPSSSMMCKNSSVSSTLKGTGVYDGFVQQGATILTPADVIGEMKIPIQAYTDYSMGQVTCFCGWTYTAGQCVVPESACPQVCLLVACVNCMYDYATFDSQLHQTYYYLASAWDCPSHYFGPNWGFLDASTAQSWMQGGVNMTFSTRDLLQYGRAGLRLGNVYDIVLDSSHHVNPTQRVIPIENGILNQCDYATRSQLDPMTLAEELFPIAHGVGESGVAAYCLRYLIEKARLTVLDMAKNSSHFQNAKNYAQQQQLVYSWAKKCGSQLYLLHLCVSLNIFQSPVPNNVDSKRCTYFTEMREVDFYTTGDCLVHLEGEFYDPCRCLPCTADSYGDVITQTLNRTYLKATSACKLRFDPRNKATNLHAPIGWWEGESVEYINFLNLSLLEYLLNDTDAVGNTPYNQSWMTAEGYMSSTADECDMFVDYWPDEWDYPVGYHVSTTCDADDTAFRSFENSFTVETDSSGDPVIKYQNDLMREGEDIDVYFGVGGFCRQNTFGMSLIGLNNMVYCTKMPLEDVNDVSIPNFKASSGSYTEEKCSSSPTDLPWDTSSNVYKSFKVSIGTVPNLPSAASGYYPEDLTLDMMDIGSTAFTVQGWSADCRDYNLHHCQTNVSCGTGYTCRGRRCDQATEYVSCTSDSDCVVGTGLCKGVCIHSSIDCIRHSDCLNGYMCSGTGKCRQPKLIIENPNATADFMVQVQVQGNNTDSLGIPYSLLGASYWGYMGSDLLNMHGMCSYENWYKYKQYYMQSCQTGSTSNVCWINPQNTNYVDLSMPVFNSSQKWWSGSNKPYVMYVRPTVCDRDYERLDGFTLIQPFLANISLVSEGKQTYVPTTKGEYYNNFTKAYVSTTAIPMAKLNFSNANNFLFGSTLQPYMAQATDPLQKCSTFRQCIPSPFTRNFTSATRKIGITTYDNQNTFICGAIGYLDSTTQKCKLDTSVFPLYNFFCVSTYKSLISKCSWTVSESVRTDVCNKISTVYEPDYTTIVNNVKALVNMFFMFENAFTSYIDIMKTSDCAVTIYSHIKSSGLYSTNTLYYPLTFVLKEIPYDWFYHCILMNTNPIIREDIATNQDCPAYKSPTYVVTAGGYDLQEYLRKVRMGFTYTNYYNFSMTMQAKGASLLNQLAQNIRNVYPGKQDMSYPICSRYRSWKYYQGEIRNMLIYNSYVPLNCQTTWQNHLLKIINERNTQISHSSNYEIEELQTFVPDDGGPPTKGGWNTENWKFFLSETYIPSDTNNTDWQIRQSVTPTTLVEQIIADLQSNWHITQEAQKVRMSYSYAINDPNPTLDPSFYIVESEITSLITSNNMIDYPMRCAYQLRDKGLLNDPTCVGDKLWTCSNKQCTEQIPWYSHMGRFFCHYHYLDNLIGIDVNKIDITDVEAVYTSLYNYLRNLFTTSIAASASTLDLEKFQFFTDTDWQTSWGLDFAAELKYISNNQPDTSKSVMCTISSTSTIDYNTCNHPHWLKIKDHVNTYYRHNGGLIIPAGKQLQWKVNSSLFLSGFITSYSSMDKKGQENYLDQLFDENNVCIGDSNDWSEKVCYKYNDPTQHIGVINPWLHGYYNPYMRCDVKYGVSQQINDEYIDTFIYPDANGYQYPPDMPLGAACLSIKGQQVVSPSPSRFNTNPLKANANFPYNLCHHQLNQPSDCTHDQGLLGGDDGLFVGTIDSSFNMFRGSSYTEAFEGYTVASDLYSNSKWVIPDDLKSGLFGGTNPLWQGYIGPAGFLQVPEYELGIHTIGMTIVPPNKSNGELFSVLLVTKLPLSTSSTDENLLLSLTQSKTVDQWVPSLLEDLVFEDAINMRTYRHFFQRVDETTQGYSCPLRRYAFYGRNDSNFRPILPHPGRAKFMFAKINQDLFAHPTMTHSTDGSMLGTYKTVNGFCYCPYIPGTTQKQCQLPVSVSTTCSLDHTIQTLKAMDDQWYDSYVFLPKDVYGNTKQCDMQIDWPFISNTLRDGSSPSEEWNNMWYTASDQYNRKCHVLDRLASFKYRYKNTNTIKVDATRTTVSAGVCKTGRLSNTDSVSLPTGGRCVKQSTTVSSTTHSCDNVKTSYTLFRKQASNASVMYIKYKNQTRSKCNKCSKPPSFVDHAGNKINSETSFGVAYKLSATKVLAQDLRNALVEGGAGALINEQYWTKELFLKTYLQTPALLLNLNLPVNTTNSTLPAWAYDDRDKWKQPWVYCPDAASFRNKSCLGFIERENWIKNKVKICPHMVKSFMKESNADPMAKTSFANIDKTTNKVALAIADAREMIINANCIASGQLFCLPQPFVYHPASYETTNQAWVHDTVVQYYQSVNSLACSANTKTQAFLTYLTEKQISCPANNFYLFEAFLRIIRVVVTDVAVLLTSMSSILIKLVAAPFSSSAKSSLITEWSSVKRSSSKFFDTLSDLMVDMVMNSGLLGAKITAFIRSSCQELNHLIDWFATMWCSFLTNYLFKGFTNIKGFVGGIAKGLQLIQQFIYGMIKDTLPLDFIITYLSSPVVSLMSSVYSQPSEKSDRTKTQQKPVSVQPQSRIAQSNINSAKMAEMNAANNKMQKVSFMSKVTKVGAGAAGTVGTMLVGMAVSQLVGMAADKLEGELKDSIMGYLWPSNTKLFDFQDVIDVIDNILTFITNDQRCVAYQFLKTNPDYNGLISCPTFSVDPVDATNPAKSIAPTMCWATATTSLGQSSAYSCSASSTCCPATGCSSDKTNNVLCADCPAPTTGVTQFACENMVCKCGVPIQEISYCAANSQCDASSSCELISSVSSVSYGTLACSDCPGRVICMASYAGVASKCTCMMDDKVNMATCFETAGTLTYPDPGSLCGYLPRLSSSSTDTTFSFTDIMVVMCKSSMKTICANVYMSNGVAVNMPMSYEVRFKSRRLLFVEEDLQAPSVYTYENEYDILSHEDVHEIMHRPLWNLSSTPCSSLAYAYQNHVKLGILEEHELHKCAYWRHVGSNIIRDFNLTALKNKETFLVSLDDLSAAIVQKDAFVQVFKEPRLLIKIAVMHPYIKPLRALFILSANMLEEKIHELQKITNTSQLPNMDELVRSIADKLEVKIDQNINRTRTLNKIKSKIKSKKTGKRKLLTTISDIQAVQEYSSQVIQGAQSPPLALVVAQSWIRGPFAWPPKYSYSISDCTIVSVVWQALKEIVYVTINYFRHFNDPTPVIDRSLKGNLPGIKVYGNTVNYTITKSYKTWNQWIYYSTLDLLHIQPQDIIEFLIGENKWNLMWIVQTSISCDLGTVMSCSRHTRDLFASIFVFILFYFMIYFIGNALGWPSLSTIFLLNFPLFMLWYVYGMAPSCLPMLPTCLLDDIVSMVERTFPPNIYFPTPLYCEQSVPEFFPNASVCLKSCKDIGFTEFFDSFTYSICSYDSVLCSQLQGLTTSIQPLSNSFGRMYNVTVLNQDLAAWNFCMWIEFVNTIPIIIVFLVLVSVAAGSLYAILSLIPAFVGLFTQYLVYNHT